MAEDNEVVVNTVTYKPGELAKVWPRDVHIIGLRSWSLTFKAQNEEGGGAKPSPAQSAPTSSKVEETFFYAYLYHSKRGAPFNVSTKNLLIVAMNEADLTPFLSEAWAQWSNGKSLPFGILDVGAAAASGPSGVTKPPVPPPDPPDAITTAVSSQLAAMGGGG